MATNLLKFHNTTICESRILFMRSYGWMSKIGVETSSNIVQYELKGLYKNTLKIGKVIYRFGPTHKAVATYIKSLSDEHPAFVKIGDSLIVRPDRIKKIEIDVLAAVIVFNNSNLFVSIANRELYQDLANYVATLPLHDQKKE